MRNRARAGDGCRGVAKRRCGRRSGTRTAMATVFPSPAALLPAVGTELGPTEWVTITQDQIDKFAEATLDNQWIHVDTERAKAGPFGAPIAHGYLTLSLASHFLSELVRVEGITMGIN